MKEWQNAVKFAIKNWNNIVTKGIGIKHWGDYVYMYKGEHFLRKQISTGKVINTWRIGGSIPGVRFYE